MPCEPATKRSLDNRLDAGSARSQNGSVQSAGFPCARCSPWQSHFSTGIHGGARWSILTLDRVTKRFDRTTAVDDLSFAVREGEVFGFLGGNGAGKTTSLRMVLDIIRPTAGTDRRCSAARPAAPMPPEIGFLPEERGLYRQMTALDTIVYFGRLKGMTAADARTRGLRAARPLRPRRQRQVDRSTNCPRAWRRRSSWRPRSSTARGCCCSTSLFRGSIRSTRGCSRMRSGGPRPSGATVIFSTHVMQHAERLCDRLLLLASGRKKFEGTLDEARGQLAGPPVDRRRASRSTLAGVAGVEPRRRRRRRTAGANRTSS